eukprot:15366827-Ditylum_brightwellii.AAC.3
MGLSPVQNAHILMSFQETKRSPQMTYEQSLHKAFLQNGINKDSWMKEAQNRREWHDRINQI